MWHSAEKGNCSIRREIHFYEGWILFICLFLLWAGFDPRSWGEHSESTLKISVWRVFMSWCKLHPPRLYFPRNGVYLDWGLCCQLDLLQNLPCRSPVTAPALRFFGFLYRPCGAATQPRNPAPPQPPGRSMWQLPCKIPKSLQRHLVLAWENRWQHWHSSLSACFSF